MPKQLTGSFLIALGGNALDVKETETTTLREEFNVAHRTMETILTLMKKGHDKLVITHGNGPQVGRIFLQQELTKGQFKRQTPLDVCVADTQGRIGNLLQNSFHSLINQYHMKKECVTLITQVEVDPKDPAFANPTKPIGQFYSQEDSEKLAKTFGWSMKQEGNKGYRRVVPSPRPIDIVEKEIFHLLLEQGVLAIGGGGGGIPVIRHENGTLEGIEAVIDKDRTSSLLSAMIGIETFVILTEAPYVCLNYGTKDERKLSKITMQEAEGHLKEGQFPAGNMGPKVESAIDFLKQGGERVIIANLYDLADAIAGKTGTTIIR